VDFCSQRRDVRCTVDTREPLKDKEPLIYQDQRFDPSLTAQDVW